MTLNDLERRNGPYFCVYSPILIALHDDYVTVVEDRAIMSVKYCIPVPVFHFWPKLTLDGLSYGIKIWTDLSSVLLQCTCLTDNTCIATKRKKDLSRFLYHTKDHLASEFSSLDRVCNSAFHAAL